MKANAKYTVSEILNELDINPAEVVGKVRVRVGGISFNDPEATVTVQPTVKKLTVIVGVDQYEVDFEKGDDTKYISEGAQAHLEAKGVESTKKAEALQEAKKKANEEVEETEETDEE